MAVGASALARRKAIVTRLESIEEMASMEVLCSDKTGTLTQNKLALGKIRTFADSDEQTLLLHAALASKAENRDAIDEAVLKRAYRIPRLPERTGRRHSCPLIRSTSGPRPR
jgi:H+-transporting ATPase